MSNADIVRAAFAAYRAQDRDLAERLLEYGLGTGDRFRNTEFITVRDDQIHEIEVFFGGKI